MPNSSSLFIPPLPSAKPVVSDDKENTTGAPSAKVTERAATKCSAVPEFLRTRRAERPSRPALATKHASPSANAVTEETETAPSSSGTSARLPLRSVKNTPLRSAGRRSACRVVRYGETVDSLFCLQKDSCEDHRVLCNEIANGNKADEPLSWRKSLQMASRYASSPSSLSKIEGRDLIRLHRRATTRFPIRFGSAGTSSKREAAKDVVAIWLLYAEAQAKFASRTEAQQTYQRILTLSKGQEVDDSTVYLAVANFECADENRRSGTEKAIGHLKMGIERGVKPIVDLKVRLRELEQACSGLGSSCPSPLSIPALPVSSKQPIISRLPDEHRQGGVAQKRGTSTAGGNKPQNRMPKVSFGEGHSACSDDDTDIVTFNKQSKSNTKAADDNADTIALDGSCDNSESENTNTAPEHENETDDGPDTAEETIAIPPGLKFPVRPQAAEQVVLGGKTSSKATTSTSKDPPTTVSKPKSLLRAPQPQTPAVVPNKRIGALPSGKPFLSSRKRLGGGAMRIEALTAEASTSDDEEDDTLEIAMCSKSEARKKQRMEMDDSDGLVLSKPGSDKQKITRTDLNYMLNWNPLGARKSKTSTPDGHDDFSIDTFSPDQEAKETSADANDCATNGTKNSSSSTCSSKASNKTPGNTTSSHTGRSSGSGPSPRKQVQEHATPMNWMSSTPVSTPSLSPAEMALVAKSDMDFLPLVSKDNIIRVNNVPYAKLGVIGKGGSCKVYRALSTEFSVLAIKKVKLGGMDKKAISGYANEIKLLKRLRGNPAIIQLFDSEVDLKRKAIFLVMEPGEVDLNHVLQQQALMDDTGTSHRNMNFIRLTWQQMLSAVHCIHEERIIHGDLKPANFLFVRGTLKLIDFGIAKAIQSDDTTNIYRDSQIGTLNYMSPEAILDSGSGGEDGGAQMRCGKPSDVWALGCILYQMCYGRTPFAELHVIQKLQAIVNPKHKVKYPDTVDEAAIDAMQLCLRRTSEDRAPIIGKNGLLNEHWFLHSKPPTSRQFKK